MEPASQCTVGGLDLVFFDFLIEGAAADPQTSAAFCLVPVALFKDLLEEPGFIVRDGLAGGRRLWARPTTGPADRGLPPCSPWPARRRARSCSRVPARCPAMVVEQARMASVLNSRISFFCVRRRPAGNAGQNWNVVLPVAQRRKLDGDDVQPVKEVLAELPGSSPAPPGSCSWRPGCEHPPLSVCSPPDALEFLALQGPAAA